MLKFILAVALLATYAVAQLPSAVNLTVTSNGHSTVQALPGTLPFTVRAQLSNSMNEGLAAIVFDLVWSGGNIAQATAGTAMTPFKIPQGVNNPAGFGGTVSGNRLKQVGGAQNTIANTLGAYPLGAVVTGIGQPGNSTIVVTGTVTVPAGAGAHSLSIENVHCNVIRQGELGVPFWKVEQASIGTITNLAVNVSLLTSNAATLSLTTGGSVGMTLQAGAAFASTPYFVGGSATGTAPGIPVSATAVVPLTWDWYTDFTLTYANASVLANNLGMLDASGTSTITFSIPGGVIPASLAGLTLHHAGLGLPPAYVSNPVSLTFTL